MNRPYHIYTYSRPARGLILIEKDDFKETEAQLSLIESLSREANSSLEGRFHQLVHVENGKLKPTDEEEIPINDADFLCFLGPSLEDTIVKTFTLKNRFCGIFGTKKERTTDPAQALASNPSIPIWPCKEAITYPTSTFLHLTTDPNIDPFLKLFLDVNFGLYAQWEDPVSKKQRHLHGLEQALAKISPYEKHISNLDDLKQLFVELGGSFGREIPCRKPMQFTAACDLSNNLSVKHSWRNGRRDSIYQIIVGDDLESFINHQNSLRWNDNQSLNYNAQLWVPTSLIKESTFIEALARWFVRYSWQSSDSITDIRCYSSSSSKELLDFVDNLKEAIPGKTLRVRSESISALLDKQKKHIDDSRHHKIFPLSRINDNHPFLSRMRCLYTEERIPSKPVPSRIPTTSIDQAWICDLQIEQVPYALDVSNESRWWTLPKNETYDLLTSMFRRPTRINRDKNFSVLIDPIGSFLSARDIENQQINIRLPDEQDVVSYLTRLKIESYYKNKGLDLSSIDVKRSADGGYLQGLIHLFGTFEEARTYYESVFWNKVFVTLSDSGLEKDEALLERASTLIKKKSNLNDDNSRHLASKVLRMANKSPMQKSMSLFDFEQIFQQLNYSEEQKFVFKKGPNLSSYHIDPHDIDWMKIRLDNLLHRKILRLGLELKCPSCSLKRWLPIDDVNSFYTCVGCGETFALSCKHEWKFALNHLVATGVSQKTMDVLQAVSELAYSFNSSFFYANSQEVFIDSKSNKEFDVLCMIDGEFVVGEVKSGRLYKQDFLDLAESVEMLNADRGILFIHAGNLTDTFKKLEKEMSERLKSIGASFEVHELTRY